MKLFILALSLIALPALAETSQHPLDAATGLGVCLGNYQFGVCVGNNDRGPGWHHGPGWGPGPGWDDEPGWHHGPGWGPGPGWGRPLQCVSENARGYRFRGFGRFPEEAQRNSLDNCYSAGSRYCRVIWCN